jgi:hypothetical protein
MTTTRYIGNNLIEAIRAGRLDAVITALNEGADVETPDMHGCRGLPLRAACFEGNLAVVRELLSHGANPNAVASDGPGAPLRLALRKGHQEIAALLLQQGARIPEGIVINPETFAIPCEPLPGETNAPSVPAAKPDNVIEFSPSNMTLPTEEDESPAHFGTETNVLSMDLMFLEENDPQPVLVPSSKSKD